jgi:hypothetical protein
VKLNEPILPKKGAGRQKLPGVKAAAGNDAASHASSITPIVDPDSQHSPGMELEKVLRTDEDYKLKYVLELVLRLQAFFAEAKVKPMQWFDILTSWRKKKPTTTSTSTATATATAVNRTGSNPTAPRTPPKATTSTNNSSPLSDHQILYYNEFSLGLQRFCDELDFPYFREEEKELLFHYFLRPLPENELAEMKKTTITVDNNSNTTQIKAFFPFLRRHDFKLGFRKLKLSHRKVIWLNHQAKILKKCARYLKKLDISFYSFCIPLMYDLQKLYHANYNNEKALENFDEFSINSATSLASANNIHLFKKKNLSIHEL